MNNPLKQKIEEAAEEYQDSILNRLGPRRNVQAAFKAGAQFMLGYILREIMENALQQEIDQFGLKKGNTNDKI